MFNVKIFHMTIQERIKLIRTESGQTQEQFARSIGLKRDNYAQIEIGKQLPSYETVSAIVRIYNKTYDWIIEGKEGKVSSQVIGTLKGKLTGKVGGKVQGKVEEVDGGKSYTKNLTPEVFEHIVVDTSGIKLVPIVDIKAAAGSGYINADSFEAEDVIHLPSTLLKKNGYYLCIRVKGVSMAPTLQDGGYIIIRLLDQSEWRNMLNDRIYVVVDKEGKSYLKRVKNRFQDGEKGFLVLSSDSLERSSYPSFNLKQDEISFIWYVEWYFSAKMPNIHDTYSQQIGDLQFDLMELGNEVAEIKKRLK